MSRETTNVSWFTEGGWKLCIKQVNPIRLKGNNILLVFRLTAKVQTSELKLRCLIPKPRVF